MAKRRRMRPDRACRSAILQLMGIPPHSRSARTPSATPEYIGACEYTHTQNGPVSASTGDGRGVARGVVRRGASSRTARTVQPICAASPLPVGGQVALLLASCCRCLLEEVLGSACAACTHMRTASTNHSAGYSRGVRCVWQMAACGRQALRGQKQARAPCQKATIVLRRPHGKRGASRYGSRQVLTGGVSGKIFLERNRTVTPLPFPKPLMRTPPGLNPAQCGPYSI